MTVGVQKAWIADFNRRWRRVLKGVENAEGGAVNALNEQMTEHLLAGDWQNEYVDATYKRGMLDGSRDLRKADITDEALTTAAVVALFSTRRHEEAVRQMYLTVSTGLRKIAEDTSRQVADLVLVSAPSEVPAIVADRVEHIGKTRSTILAKSDAVKSHHFAKLEMYDDAGVANITIMAEWVTAGDDRVCPICAPLEGTTYTLEEARGIIPAHAGCRCSTRPINAQQAA